MDDTSNRAGAFRDPVLQADLARYGYVIVRLFSSGEIAALQAIFARYQDFHSGGFSATLLSSNTGYRRRVHDELQSYIGPKIDSIFNGYRAVACGFAIKRPIPTSGAISLHQDITIASDDNLNRPSISLWAPLMGVEPINGCLQVVPGSHRLNRLARAPGTPSAFAGIEKVVRAHCLISLPISAGDVLLFDQALFHASEPNRGRKLRPILATPLVPSEAPLLYYHRMAEREPVTLEVFQVPEDFFLTHTIGHRPADGCFLHEQPEAINPITYQRLVELPLFGGCSTLGSRAC